MEMEKEKMCVEINFFIKVWITVFTSLTYCYFVSSKIKKGNLRLLSILPIICIFFFLPLNLTTIALGSTTGFFIAWLANFKLLLLAFGLGPLSSDPSVSLLRFISISCLPIKIQQNPSPNIKNRETPSPQITEKSHKSTLNYAIKCLSIALMVFIYDYKQHIHLKVLLFIYCVNIYFALEVLLAMFAFLARLLLGLELEPQFNDPYLSTSLQDFWGKRWNLMVTSILHPTVYVPVRAISTLLLGRKWAMVPAVLATFVVSGVMHELIFYYMCRVRPTWEVTCFFVLHGVCLAVEIGVKRGLKDRWRLHLVFSRPLTIGFVMVTGFSLFFPQLLRCELEDRARREIVAMFECAKDMMRISGVASRIGGISS